MSRDGLVIVAIIAIAFIFGCHYILLEYERHREFDELIAVSSATMLIDEFKSAYALENKWTNGYQPTLLEVLPQHAQDPDKALDQCTISTWTAEIAKQKQKLDWVFVINPVGMHAVVRFPHGLAGFTSNSEVPGPCAKLIYDLWILDQKKARLARDARWKKGDRVTWEEIGVSARVSNEAIYSLNGIGEPATVKLKAQMGSFPAGDEISLEECKVNVR